MNTNETIKTRKAYRQGELVFLPLSQTDLETLGFDPEDSKNLSWNRLSDHVIREGEATGHKHEVVEQIPGTAAMLAPSRQLLPGLPNMGNIGIEDRMLTVKKPVEVVHPEHKPLELPVGIYLIIIQREYDEVKTRRILD